MPIGQTRAARRSIGFQFAALLGHLKNLPERDETRCHVEELVSSALSAVRAAQVGDLSQRDGQGHLGRLVELLEQLKGNMYDLSDALAAHYLSPVVRSQFVSSL